MDFDGDGYQDIVSGSWDGDATLFLGSADGTYAKGETIKDKNGQLIDVGSASAVFLADWDSDGDLDLISGEIGGGVFLAVNDGTRAAPAYAPPVAMTAAGTMLNGGGSDSGPIVTDWDGDGKHDLLVGGGDGSVTFYRNVGAHDKPELAVGELLVRPSSTMTPGGTEPATPWGVRLKLAVCDYDGDGLSDLLAGDFAMEPTSTRELTEEEIILKAKAEQAFNDVYARYTAFIESLGENPSEGMKGREQEYQIILHALSETQVELQKYQPDSYEHRGNVWVFLRKGPEDHGGSAG